MRATSIFDVTGWDETPYDEPDDAPSLSRATVTKTFRGDLNGTSTAEVLMCMKDRKNYAAGAGYIASERISGVMCGSEGSFVLQHGGLSGVGQPESTYGHIVPGSGTGELGNISGVATISRDADGKHSIEFDIELE